MKNKTLITSAQKPWIGVWSLVLATVFYGSFGLIARIIGFNIPILFAGVVRNVLSASILLIPICLNKTFRPMSKRDLTWVILRSASGIVGLVGGYYALVYLPIGTAYFITFGSFTVMSFLLGKFLFGEKTSKITYFSLVVALVGLWLVYSVSINPDLIQYVWWALLGGVGSSSWNILSKKISAEYSATQLNGLDCLFFALITSVISLALKESWTIPSLTVPWLGNLVFMVVFLFAGSLVITGFKHIDAQRGSLILLLEIVFGILVGAVFFHETLTLFSFIGGSMIIGAAALPELYGLRKK